jgi:uncharacterized Ntn-hydrolase superfamily protein
MTYSIVARDPATGALGVGVQTHQPSVGAIVPWVKAGVGAVATQSFANINFGPQGLALLENGLESARTLAALVAGDTSPGVRQLAVIDDSGAASAHTGVDCIPFAGHLIGEQFSCQANMMTSAGVPEAMADAFHAADGLLATRIMTALEAAQAAGGDIRGSQSAAILVRERGPLSPTWDLRIDNSGQPLTELRGLLNIRLAGQLLSAESINRSTSLEAARAKFAAAEALHSSHEQTFWFAVNSLTAMEQLDDAQALLEPLFAVAPQWRELLERLELPGALAIKPRFGL